VRRGWGATRVGCSFVVYSLSVRGPIVEEGGGAALDKRWDRVEHVCEMSL